MKHIFLGSYFSGIFEEQILENSIGPIASANNKLQKNIINGFLENDISLETITMPQIGAYPVAYRKLFFKGNSKEYLSFLNIKLLKHFWQFIVAYKYLKKILRQNKESYIKFYTYDIHIPYLASLFILKKRYNFKSICIIPDLIGQTGEKHNILLSAWQSFQSKVLQGIIKGIDGFSFITQQMNNEVNIYNKSYTIIEGIAPIKTDRIKVSSSRYGKYIFYAGALTERNGVKTLIESFNLLVDKSYSLVICGGGDLSEFIQNESNNNNNIYFLGFQPEDVIWELECSAFVLINPRPNIEVFTKYSFPSKTMEYMATGRPVIMYKLDGVPIEYYEYIYIIYSTSSHHLAKELDKLLNDISLHPFKNGRDYILKNKNAKIQVKKLIELI